MHISLIVAMANNRVIGKNNQLPWHLPADLKHFKTLTLNKTVVMGRKTYESIGKPLPQRRNIILTSDPAYQVVGCEVVNSIEAVVEQIGEEAEVFIIGGSALFEAFLPIAKRMYLTLVDADVEGDTFFPVYDESEWQLMTREVHAADERNEFGLSFLVLDRVFA